MCWRLCWRLFVTGKRKMCSYIMISEVLFMTRTYMAVRCWPRRWKCLKRINGEVPIFLSTWIIPAKELQPAIGRLPANCVSGNLLFPYMSNITGEHRTVSPIITPILAVQPIPGIIRILRKVSRLPLCINISRNIGNPTTSSWQALGMFILSRTVFARSAVSQTGGGNGPIMRTVVTGTLFSWPNRSSGWILTS